MKKVLVISIILGFFGFLYAENLPEAPDFQLTTINGEEIALSQFSGKPVILDFWATWCGPCRMEIPGFVNLKNKYKDRIEIIGISLDRNEQQVRNFVKNNRVNYPVAMATKDIINAYSKIQRIMYIPTTFIINGEGKVYKVFVGFTPEEEFEKIIKNLLNEKD